MTARMALTHTTTEAVAVAKEVMTAKGERPRRRRQAWASIWGWAAPGSQWCGIAERRAAGHREGSSRGRNSSEAAGEDLSTFNLGFKFLDGGWWQGGSLCLFLGERIRQGVAIPVAISEQFAIGEDSFADAVLGSVGGHPHQVKTTLPEGGLEVPPDARVGRAGVARPGTASRVGLDDGEAVGAHHWVAKTGY